VFSASTCPPLIRRFWILDYRQDTNDFWSRCESLNFRRLLLTKYFTSGQDAENARFVAPGKCLTPLSLRARRSVAWQYKYCRKSVIIEIHEKDITHLRPPKGVCFIWYSSKSGSLVPCCCDYCCLQSGLGWSWQCVPVYATCKYRYINANDLTY